MTTVRQTERTLAKEITLLLIIKICALSVLWYAFFSDPVIPSMIDGMDPNQVSSAVLQHSVKKEVQLSEGSEQTNFR